MLSKKHLQDICMAHQGSGECRYLHQDDSDYNKYYCMKHRAIQKQKIDDLVANYVKECKKRSIDPKSEGKPLGDNCSGYPYLKHIEQGYDKKS